MVDLFISYSRANRDTVRGLADAVAGLGYAVWWDEELPAHLSYGEVITEKIGEARATLVVWSRESAASEWVRAEADMARNRKKLIQAAIDDCMPPLPFNQIQYAALGDWRGEEDHPGWRKIRASLAALCGPAPAGAARAGAGPAVAPPAPGAPAVRRAPRSRTTRLACVAIAASLLTMLSVGGLVLLKGPPAAQAQPAPPPPAPPPASSPDAPSGPAPVEAAAPAAEEGAGAQDSPSAEDAPEPGQDVEAE